MDHKYDKQHCVTTLSSRQGNGHKLSLRLRNLDTINALKSLIRAHQPYCVLLLEMKFLDSKLDQLCRHLGFPNNGFVDAKGLA